MKVTAVRCIQLSGPAQIEGSEERQLQMLDIYPEMARRAFVLVPLCEIEPDWTIPGDGRTARDLLIALAPDKEVRIWRSSATRPPT